jgi:hypothetical protein
MMANAQTSKANYTIKGVETVVEGADVTARVFTLAPATSFPGTRTPKPRTTILCCVDS